MPSSIHNSASNEAALRSAAFTGALEEFQALLKTRLYNRALLALDSAFELSTGDEAKEMIEHYARFIHSSASRIQLTALRCGNLLPEHLELLQHSLAASRKLQRITRASQNGIGEILSKVLIRNAEMGILVLNQHTARRLPGFTEAAELDELLKTADALIEESKQLMKDEPDEKSKEAQLQSVRDALSNAIHYVPRFFPGADYARAEVLCRHARQALVQSERSDLENCLQALARSCQALKSGKKKESRDTLEAASKLLQSI